LQTTRSNQLPRISLDGWCSPAMAELDNTSALAALPLPPVLGLRRSDGLPLQVCDGIGAAASERNDVIFDTVPGSSTDGPLDTAAGIPDRRGSPGTAVLVSTLRTSVMCGPLCPGPTRTSTVSPGCTALMPLPARTLPCRKASPDPSDSSTNPKPFSGLNHFTTARIGGPEGASEAVRLKRGRVPKARGCGA
jgi:hypothetical protein